MVTTFSGQAPQDFESMAHGVDLTGGGCFISTTKLGIQDLCSDKLQKSLKSNLLFKAGEVETEDPNSVWNLNMANKGHKTGKERKKFMVNTPGNIYHCLYQLARYKG